MEKCWAKCYVQYFIDLCIWGMFTLALVSFLINILNTKSAITSWPKSQRLQSSWENLCLSFTNDTLFERRPKLTDSKFDVVP